MSRPNFGDEIEQPLGVVLERLLTVAMAEGRDYVDNLLIAAAAVAEKSRATATGRQQQDWKRMRNALDEALRERLKRLARPGQIGSGGWPSTRW